jgi:DNA-binding NarL/FixJ family response regulator
MADDRCHVLLIEDDKVHQRLIYNLLAKGDDEQTYIIELCDCLADGIAYLADHHNIDVILLDLNLPDSHGLETLLALQSHLTEDKALPIIIQTGNDDENLVVKAFQLGVEGYLKKSTLDRKLLIYSIKLAIAHEEYVAQLQSRTQQVQQDLEFAGLEEMASDRNTSITARMFGAQPLQASAPDLFNEFVRSYCEILDHSLEQKVFKVDYDVSDELRMIAEKLGFMKASPRDVISIHTQSLKIKTKEHKNNAVKIQAYVNEGRLMVLELMGYLTSFYRKYYIGLSNINITASSF